MSAATIRKSWQVANNGGWAETFNFYLGSASTPDTLTGYSATLSLIRPGRPSTEALVYNSTDSDPYVSVVASPGAVNIVIPASVTSAWTPGQYDVQLRVYGSAPEVDRYNLIGPGRLTVLEAPGT